MTATPLDSTVWLRAQAWGLWKALITIADQRPTPGLKVQCAALAELLADC